MAYEIFMGINFLLAGSLVLFLLVPVQLLLISLFHTETPSNPSKRHQFFSCIITVYKTPVMCRLLIDSLLSGSYPHFEIIVILDNVTERFEFDHPKVKVIYPPEPLHSKMKSVRTACDYLDDQSDAVIVFDPDNLAHPESLTHLNNAFLNPFSIIQGRRKAKNTNSPLSRADALNEAYYNYTDRELLFKAGSSSTLAGSGFCVEKEIMLRFLEKKKENIDMLLLGEDKLLQNYLVQQGYRIAYARHAVTYDEKVSLANQMRRQRARWINAYFENMKESARTFIRGFLTTNWNMIVFGLATVRPPVFLNLALLSILLILNIFVYPPLAFALGAAIVLFFIFFTGVIIRNKMVRYLPALPTFLFNQVIAVFSAPQYRKEFGKTSVTAALSIEDVLKNDHLP